MANFSILTARRTFVSIDPTYTDLVSSGNIGLITDEELRLKLIKYYQNLERIEKIIQSNNSLIVDDKFVPFILKYGALSDEYLLVDERNYFDSIGAKYFSARDNPDLPKTAEQLLNLDENELLAINTLNLRNNTALAQYTWMTELLDTTNELIRKLEQARKE